ncbi:putative damage-inducible protein DinB [Roseibium hamelinense]|uniref:Putative damage-inducible protein DinB n=1 Tax=Roseibium hamelinense TaxID=150831 RepID=A0A562TIT4_9HYPH|nr:DinB family protein [Roseibium hamelinense]MTI42303.1 hypothetical protein [Roseibium hamelinense]TWI93224.1 putative damage-inducible protein DinB [Roseibium hamelinense]
MKSIIRMMCDYNAWANRRLLDDCTKVSQSGFGKFISGETGSLCEVLSRGLQIDQSWLARLVDENAPSLINARHPIREFSEYRYHRMTADDRLVAYAHDVTEAQLVRPLRHFNNTDCGDVSMPAALALFYLFQQQTHYRAQAQVALSLLDVACADLDMMIFQRLSGLASIEPSMGSNVHKLPIATRIFAC